MDSATWERPQDFHPQDWALIAEALVRYTWDDDITGDREERAWQLMEAIAVDQSLSPTELIRQIESAWPR